MTQRTSGLGAASLHAGTAQAALWPWVAGPGGQAGHCRLSCTILVMLPAACPPHPRGAGRECLAVRVAIQATVAPASLANQTK